MSTLIANPIVTALPWAGGKKKLLKKYEPLLPEADTLTDLFSGSGVVVANLNYKNRIANDINLELQNAFRQLQNNRVEVLSHYKDLSDKFLKSDDPKGYYQKLLKEYAVNYETGSKHTACLATVQLTLAMAGYKTPLLATRSTSSPTLTQPSVRVQTRLQRSW